MRQNYFSRVCFFNVINEVYMHNYVKNIFFAMIFLFGNRFYGMDEDSINARKAFKDVCLNENITFVYAKRAIDKLMATESVAKSLLSCEVYCEISGSYVPIVTALYTLSEKNKNSQNKFLEIARYLQETFNFTHNIAPLQNQEEFVDIIF